MRLLAVFGAATALLAGCVERTVSITSDPPGALVWLNDREVGRTPVDVKFDYYGTYDVRLEREGSEPLMTSGKADAPWWEFVGIDLIAEALPFRFHSHIKWNYVLEPATGDRAALIGRAEALRDRESPHPPPPPETVPITSAEAAGPAPAARGP